MTDKTLSVRISATDNASTVLAKIGDSAKTLGTSLEEAGKSADSLDQVASSATKVGPAMASAAKQGSTGFAALRSEVVRLESQIGTAGRAVLTFGGAITAAFTLPLAAGTRAAWNQVDAVQQATAALRAYEKDADKVNQVLADLVAYARSDLGVLFQRQDLFHAAQALRVMGAETERLVEYVEIMSRSVGVGAGTWQELEQVIGRVGSTGQLTGVEFDNLTKMGFQLDDSLRNSVVTWDELFAALDKGIPADALANQMGTIEATSIRLQSALRNLGAAFLGVDTETSAFIEGGLGDQIVRSIGMATQTLNEMRPAAQAFGEGVGTAAGAAVKLLEAFNALPGPAQRLIAVTTGIGGATLVATSSIALMINPTIRLGTALATLGRSAVAARALAVAINPLTAGVGLLTVAGWSLWDSWKEGERVANSLESAIDSLNAAYEQLLLDGQLEMASNVELVRDLMADMERLMEGQFNILTEGMGPENFAAWHELKEAYTFTADEAARFEQVQVSLGQRLSDTRIDTQALTDEIERLFNLFLVDPTFTGDDFLAALEDLDARAVEDFRIGIDDAANSLDNLGDSATGLRATWALLRTEGDSLVDMLRNLNTVTEDDSFSDRLLKTLGLDASQRGQIDMVIGRVRELNTELTDMPGPGAEQEEWVAWVNEAAVGTIEYTRRAEAANAARREEAQTSQALALTLMTAAGAHDTYREMVEQAAQAQEELSRRITENREALIAVTGMDDPLSIYAARMREAEAATASFVDEADTLGGQLAAAFSDAFLQPASHAAILADNLTDAATSLDTVFRAIVGNTNAIASQVESVDKWAADLINVRGEYGKIDDLLASGRITIEQYTAAQEAQERIASATLATQESVLTIQTMQAPLIAEHTDALNAQLAVISTFPEEQQRLALAWMDTATAARAVEIQTLATAAAAGELGENGQQVFASMVEGAAIADPMLAAILEDMELISIGADGTITVHGLEETQGQFDDLILSIDALTEAMGGVPPLRIPVELDTSAMGGAGFLGGSAVAGLAETAMQGVRNQLSYAVRVEATDEASPVIATVQEAADALPDSAVVTVDAIDNASIVLEGITAQLTALGAWAPVVEIQGDGTHAQNVIDAYISYEGRVLSNPLVEILGDPEHAQSVIDAYRGYEGIVLANPLVEILGDGGHAQSVIDAYRGYEGVTLSTAYVDIVTRTLPSAAHGGLLPSYAHGGVLFEAGEGNRPEIAHFATGGTALIPHHGLYEAPRGTYISPSNTVSNAYGGHVFDFSGANFSGANAGEIERVFVERIAPALMKAVGDNERAYGGPA